MTLKVVKSPNRHPLCVDLDGTLVRSDTLLEAIRCLLQENILYLFMLPIWLSQGVISFKFQVIMHTRKFDVSKLPYNQSVLDLIAEEKEAGRPIVLATASPYPVAEKIADFLGVFSEVLATDEHCNLKGQAKADLLVKKYGDKGFDYVGNSKVDLVVWRHSQRSFLANCSLSLQAKARRIADVAAVMSPKKSLISLLAKQIRVHQWAKNILIFCPMILSHQYFNIDVWLECLHAFAAFSLVSSSVYIVNDLLDLDSDRLHPENRFRPFASGGLSLIWGVVLFPGLLGSGLILAGLLSWQFFSIIVSYVALTTAYSLRLKQLAIADIMILASLYSWRVFAGSVAAGIVLSEWFLVFSIFFFLSLALIKRCSELISLKKRNKNQNIRRGYLVDDLPLLVSFGVGSGYISVLVLALYLNTPQPHIVTHNPQLLWAIVPFLVYWISRVWLIAYRGLMPSDPLIFAMKDRISYGIFLVIFVLWLVGHRLP